MLAKKSPEEQHIAELERTLEAAQRNGRLIAESQSTVSRILSQAPVMIYLYDLVDKKNLYINREATEFLGYSTEQIQALGSEMLATLIHPEDLSRAMEHHNLLRNSDTTLKLVYRMKNASGEWKRFISCDTPFDKAPGKETRFILGCVQELPD